MSYDPDGDPLNTLTGLPMTSQTIANDLIGPWFAGWMFHLFLFGLVQSQFAAYTSTELYKRDPFKTKILLWTVVCLDLGDVFVNGSQMYHFGTSQQRDYASLYATRAIDSVPNLLCGVIALLVQLFLLERACTLFNHNLLHRTLFKAFVAFLATMSFLAQCGSFTVGIMWAYGQVERALPFTYNNLSSTWLWTSLAVDVMLCLTLVLLLRGRFVGADSHTSVRKLVNLSVQTASMTTILGVAGAIVNMFPQANNSTANVAFAFSLPLPSLYVLSLVVTLSSRKKLPVTVTGTTTIALGIKRAVQGGMVVARGEAMMSEKKRRPRRALDSDEESDDSEDDDDEEEEEEEQHEMKAAFVDLQTTAAFSIRETFPKGEVVVGPGMTLSVDEEEERSAGGGGGGARVQWAENS